MLDSVPDIDMLGFLPDFLDGNASLFPQCITCIDSSTTLCLLPPAGLFNMLSDSSHEIRQQADAALSEFLQEIKNSPVRLSPIKLLVHLYQSVNSVNTLYILPDEHSSIYVFVFI